MPSTETIQGPIGVLGLQVLHPLMMGVPEVEHYGIESNAKPFIMHPSITVHSVSDTEMTLTFSPKVEKKQRVVAMLNEYDVAIPRSYALKAPSDNGIVLISETETDSITFSLDDVEAGEEVDVVGIDRLKLEVRRRVSWEE